jgi:hypothetical protein
VTDIYKFVITEEAKMKGTSIEGRITDISETESGVLFTVYVDISVPPPEGYENMDRAEQIKYQQSPQHQKAIAEAEKKVLSLHIGRVVFSQ